MRQYDLLESFSFVDTVTVKLNGKLITQKSNLSINEQLSFEDDILVSLNGMSAVSLSEISIYLIQQLCTIVKFYYSYKQYSMLILN